MQINQSEQNKLCAKRVLIACTPKRALPEVLDYIFESEMGSWSISLIQHT